MRHCKQSGPVRKAKKKKKEREKKYTLEQKGIWEKLMTQLGN
jgi:hypothetical protein